jgi:hypothetical protein
MKNANVDETLAFFNVNNKKFTRTKATSLVTGLHKDECFVNKRENLFTHSQIKHTIKRIM